MPQAVAHGAQLADRPVELIRLDREHLAVDARLPLGREHARDLIEREAGGAPQRDQRQPFDHAGIEQAAQPAPAGGGDQPLFVLEPQRRCGNAGLLRHFGNVQVSHPLDLKLT